MTTEAAVRTRGLSKSFGGVRAVTDMDLEVPAGAFYLLIGPNGAGKTTTFRMLLGLLRPTAGTVTVCGLPATPGGAVRAQVGAVPEVQDGPYGWMRTGDLIRHHAAYYPAWDHAYADRLARVLEVRPEVKYGALSKGQARRVQLLLALAHRPPLLLLDEPTDGLDPVARDRVQAVLAEHIADTPTTVLAATHLVYEMERFADHVGVMSGSRLVRQVPRSEMHARLRRYTLDVADDWQPARSDGLTLLKENGTSRERRWTIWGDEADVRQRLAASGAHVRAVTPLTLDEAALALLSEGDN